MTAGSDLGAEGSAQAEDAVSREKGRPKESDPGPQDLSASEQSDAQDALGEMLRPAGRASAVVGSVRARTSFTGTTNIRSVVIESAKRVLRIPLTDLRALHARGTFVPPPGYADLVALLPSARITVCHGPSGCGKERAVAQAFLDAGYSAVQLVPGALSGRVRKSFGGYQAASRMAG